MGWLKKWWWLILTILAVTSVIGWRGERCQSQADECRASYEAQAQSERIGAGRLTVDQQASEEQAITAACEPHGFFCRFFSPTNLPNILLVFVGIGGVLAALRTLNTIEGQTKATEESVKAFIASERAWVSVTIDDLPDQIPDTRRIAFWRIRPTIRNHGKTVASLTKLVIRQHLVGCALYGLPEQLPEEPDYLGGDAIVFEKSGLVIPPGIPLNPVSVGVSTFDLEDIFRGKKFLYIYGFVEYSDTVANKTHTSKFCYVSWSQREFGPNTTGFTIAGSTPRSYLGDS